MTNEANCDYLVLFLCMNKIFFFFFYFRQNLLTVNIINLSVALVWVFTVLLYQHCLYTVCNTR